MVYFRLRDLLVLFLVFLQLCSFSNANRQFVRNVGVESELDLLLKIAREYRYYTEPLAHGSVFWLRNFAHVETEALMFRVTWTGQCTSSSTSSSRARK